ncbi:MAG: tetratricopeptide repeat protein, partial [Gemmatimonadales bacterium]
EFDSENAVAACLGLGEVAVAQQEWIGADAWYTRGLTLAKAAGAEHRMGELERQLGVLKRHTGDLTAAQDLLRRARERFERLGDAIELARVLNSQGELDGRLDRPAAALAAYHEALAWRRRAGSDAALEVAIRRNLAELHLRADRFLEAEAEARRAEQAAIAENQLRQLIPVYILLGRLKGRQADQTGFVFFEQAIELCRTVDHAPAVEGQLYYEYGAFKHGTGELEEARAYFERARGLFESVGVTADLDRLRDELGRRSA